MSEESDISATMRVPGIHSSSTQFDFICVHPNNSKAYRYDNVQVGFDSFDLVEAKITGEFFKLKPFKKIIEDGSRNWGNIRCVERSQRTIILVLVLENDTNKAFLVIYELKMGTQTAEIIEEYKIRGVERIHPESERRLINDEKDNLFYIDSWSNEKERKTIFNVVHLRIDHNTKVSHQTLARKQVIANYCLFQVPFIYKGCINFLINHPPLGQMVSVTLEINAQNRNPNSAKHADENIRKQYSLIVPDFSLPKSNSETQYPRFDFMMSRARKNEADWRGNRTLDTGCFSPFSFQNGNDMIFAYLITDRHTGELWSLDLVLKKWHRCFELLSHPLTSNTMMFVTSNYRLILRGTCADNNCSEKVHVYHFGISLPSQLFYPTPTIKQLEAILSRSKTQIYYGLKRSEESRTLLLKAVIAFGCVKDKNKFKIFVSSNEQKTFYRDCISLYTGKSFSTKNIFLWSETSFDSGEFLDCEIFVDGLPSLSFDQKNHLLHRMGKATIILTGKIPHGFDHPRFENFSWHRLSPSKEKSVLSVENRCNEIHDADKNQKLANMEFYIKESVETMDHFYHGWWSPALPKKTICIPESPDISKNRYLRATDKDAQGYSEEHAKDKDDLYRGQTAESDFIAIFQHLDIGGVLISGFNSEEFAKTRRHHDKFKKVGIKPTEIDVIFLHPVYGIFVFEIKATETESYLKKPTEKGIVQLSRIKQALSNLFELFCQSSLNVPVHFVLCFPNADIPGSGKEEIGDNFIFYKPYCDGGEKLRSFIFSTLTEQLHCENSFADSLKMFTAALAGYRSLDFISAGHNALAVHKMIDTQSFHDENFWNVDGIFYTNEQLKILNCTDRHQIISGPPGTGKTLILLRKALLAAQTDKKGSVHIICGRDELLLKFKKYFEQHSKGIVRFPCIWFGKRSMRSYSDDDDIFADEQYLNKLHSFEIHERSESSGQTIIVVTGLFNPTEIKEAAKFLKKNQFAKFTHFCMNTVIRSSRRVFDEWVREFNSSNYEVPFGHNIVGHKVDKRTPPNSKETLFQIRTVIRELFQLYENQQTRKKISLNSLSIITDNKESCTLIKSFLSSQNIPCGSIQEQIMNPNMVAVSVHDETVSHEWPIVIIVSFIDLHIHPEFFLIAASRCIAKLFIIECNCSHVLMKIDQNIRSLHGSRSPLLRYSNFYDESRSPTNKIGEDQKFISDCCLSLYLIRTNCFLQEINERRLFQNYGSLYYCCEIITKQSTFCRVLLQKNNILRKNMRNRFLKKRDLSEKPSAFFSHITSGHLTDANREIHWERLKLLQKALIKVLEEDANGYKANASEIHDQMGILQELNEIGDAWMIVETAINLLTRT